LGTSKSASPTCASVWMALSRDWPLSRFSPATTSTLRQRPARTRSRASISIAAARGTAQLQAVRIGGFTQAKRSQNSVDSIRCGSVVA
jgi:hypothetical protein